MQLLIKGKFTTKFQACSLSLLLLTGGGSLGIAVTVVGNGYSEQGGGTLGITDTVVGNG